MASGEVYGFLPTAMQKVINAESKVCGDFPGGPRGKEPTCNAGDIRDADSFCRSGRSPGGRHGNPLQCACLENPHGQRSLVGCSLQGHTELDMTEQLSIAQQSLQKSLQWLLFLPFCR